MVLKNPYIAALILLIFISGFFVGSLTGEATRRKGPGGGGPSPTCTDYDKDTYFGQSNCPTLQDCNDNNVNVHPYALEVCGNNIDDDCINGDIGLCSATLDIKTSKQLYSDSEGVKLV